MDSQDLVSMIIDKSEKIVLADGAANYYRQIIEKSINTNIRLPDIIAGDLESITPENITYFNSRGVNII